jgi:hypothetical protein
MKWDMHQSTWEKVAAILALLLIFCFFVFFIQTDQWFLQFYEDIFGQNKEEYFSAIDSTYDPLKIMAKRFEESIQEAIPWRLDMIEIHGLLQRWQNKRVVSDLNYGTLYKTNDLQIAFSTPEMDISADLKALKNIQQELKALDLPFVYVQAPYKLEPGKDQLPYHVREYGNDNANRLLEGLQELEIDLYDLREEFFNQGWAANELFYNTDHHWTIPGARMATSFLVEFLNAKYDLQIDQDVFDEGNFLFEVFPDSFLGSLGKRVGEQFSGTDSFTLVTPKFSTSFTVSIFNYGSWQEKQGDFSEAILVHEYLDLNAPKETNRYAAYNGDHEIIRITNHNVVEGKRILMIKDSYGLPIYSFLSLGVSEVTALDLRLFKGSVAEYAKEYQPDVVLYLFNTDAVGRGSFQAELIP